VPPSHPLHQTGAAITASPTTRISGSPDEDGDSFTVTEHRLALLLHAGEFVVLLIDVAQQFAQRHAVLSATMKTPQFFSAARIAATESDYGGLNTTN
jgi:hypothetical protein